MKIVNKSGIPLEVFEWLCVDFYDHEGAEGTISATTLLKPVQEVVLTKRHWDELEVDALSRIWSLFGSGVHEALERLEKNSLTPIERLRVDVNGMVVSGKFDRVAGNAVIDYKVTSAWTQVFGSRNPEWRKQLSIYRWLYWKAKGVKLEDTGYIIAIFRDWAERESIKQGDGDKGWEKHGDLWIFNPKAADANSYPKLPVMKIPVELMLLEETEKFVAERLADIQRASALTDDQLPRCTDEERWFNKKKQAYMKCEKYCPARQFCRQLKEEDLFA